MQSSRGKYSFIATIKELQLMLGKNLYICIINNINCKIFYHENKFLQNCFRICIKNVFIKFLNSVKNILN